MKNIFFLLFFLWFALPGFAQSGKLFSADKEISNSLIYNIYQDHNGVVWISTEDGLNRYDGAKFTIYKHDKNDSLSIKHDFVRLFFEDSKGHFLVGFYNGLQSYDYATNTFHNIPMLLDNGEPFKAHVVSIVERKNGEIVMGTSIQGIYVLSAEDRVVTAKQSSRFVPSNFILYLYEDKDENLWISTEDKGLFRLSKDNKLKNFFKYDDLVLNNISSICEDGEGNVLVGSLTKGLFRHDKNTDKFVPVVYPENPNLPIKILYPNNQHEVYIGTDGNGVKVYHADENKITNAEFNVTSFDFEKSKVHAILKDEAGNIWLGIYQKGVLLIPTQTNNFNYIGYKLLNNNTIGSNSVMSLLEDHKGVLWVGTDNDGVYAVSLAGKQYAHFTHAGEHSVSNTIMSIYEDSNNDLWVGSYLNGMAKLDRNTGRCEYVTDLVDEYGNPIQRVYAMVEDTSKQLWIGTMGGGLFSMDLRNGKITNRNKIKTDAHEDEKNVIYNYWISSLLYDDEKIYAGTYDGLVCLDLKTNSYLTTFDADHKLTGTVVYSILKDTDGNIWAGTSEGLASISKDNHEVMVYTINDGLPSNVICAVKEGNDGNLWISTHYGISQFVRASKSFINYYANDGLQGNEFSKGAAYTDKQGHFIFGGINGITYFDPEEIRFQEKRLHIRITDFYIHNQPVRKGMKSGSHQIIETSVMEVGQFRLSYKDNSFSIEFSVMEFNNPERITYVYSVNDDTWVTLHPGTNRISFSNLAPGKYNFKVKAKDYNSYSDEKFIAVIISPPWYATIWAQLIYFLIAASVIYLLVMYVRQRYRSRQKMLEHQHAEEINEAKLQFFINIAHEIRTPMSLIISPLKRLIATDSNEERSKNYRTISRNADRILNLINQLMDIRKIDKGIMVLKFQEVEMVGFIRDLYAYFEYQAKAKNIQFGFHPGVEELRAWVDPKNFDKVIMNILSNAFKYTPENGNIDIYLNTVEVLSEENNINSYFEIIVADNGIGIKEEDRERIFERFYQIRNSYNNSNISTGVGLHLTRSLVNLHHGNIRAEKNDDKGTRMVVRIPLGKGHLKTEELEDNPELMQQTGHIGEKSEGLPADMDAKIKSKTKYRVVIVEDDEEIRDYIYNELSGNYHVTSFVNGKEAFAAILKKVPDLIISDVMMPEMDGITLCRKIKQNIHINHVPVILLTARSNEEDNLEGLSTGADAYIVKPFNMEILKKTVDNLIHNREILRNTFKGNQEQEDKVKKIHLKSADEKLMEKVMKIINEYIADPDLSVEMIADKVGLSRVHLHRKLKELTNQTTRDFIRNIRLKQAADLLAGKNLTISEVAEATGFNNLGYFSKVFKELYGVSPSTYMEEQRGNSD
ncbi:MAG: response regulator [Tannerella sp.]|jgi:signal transduction histidine kinase/ligand-binding sensor domain-containing protein/AraC-like DNA-binding protein|nr:response regulator [Tannerella sp.]